MFRVISLLMATFLLSACNDLDGNIKVFSDFMLVDEDGREVMITTGTHEAEFSVDVSDGEVELEIDDIDNGRDRDFEFQIPDMSNEDFRQERLELHFPATVGDRELDTRVLITNKIMHREGPIGEYYRCREHGSAVYFLQPVVFHRVERLMHVAAHIGSNEDTLALFEAGELIKERQIAWRGACGGAMPDNLEDVIGQPSVACPGC